MGIRWNKRVNSLGKWKVSLFGLGYVGLSHAVAYALKDIRVVGFDIDKEKIKAIKKSVEVI